MDNPDQAIEGGLMGDRQPLPAGCGESKGAAAAGGAAPAVTDRLDARDEDDADPRRDRHDDIGAWHWTSGGDGLAWSSEMFGIAGRDPSRFVPGLAAMTEIIHPDDRAQFHERLQAAGSSPRQAGFPVRIVRPDGALRHCRMWIGPARADRTGMIMPGVMLDLTGWRARDAARRARAQDCRDAIDYSPQIPWTADPAGNILTVGGRWRLVTGLAEAAALGTGWLDRLHADDVAAVRAAVARSLASGDPLDVKARILCATGEARWIRARAFPKRDSDGIILRWYGVSEDIDTQETALAALRESEENHRYTLELNPQIAWTADAAGNILEAGPRWSALIGVVPQAWLAVVHPDDVPNTRARWSQSLATGERLDVRHRLRRTGGDYGWVRVRAGARRGSSGEVLRWYGIIEDIDEQVQVEAGLRAREQWIQQAHEAAGIGLFELDFDGGFARLSPQSQKLHGRAPDADPILPIRTWDALVRPQDGPRATAAIELAVAGGGDFDLTFGVPSPDGAMRWINGLGRVDYHPDGRPQRLLGINIDVTARHLAEAALHNSEALNRSIVAATPDAIKLIAYTGEILFANEACRPALEVECESALIGRNWVELWPPTVQPRVRMAIAEALAGRIGRLVAPRATARGRPKWWDVSVSPVAAGDDQPLRLVTIARDITEQKADEDRIHWAVHHDPLTHLPNRRIMDQRLAEAIIESEAGGDGLAVLILDVDHFRHINDTLGHEAGDAVLRTLSDRLRACAGPTDTVARLGGDEFGLILPGMSDPAQLKRYIEFVLAQLRAPISHAGAALDCRASIGASLYPQHGTTASDLLKHADIALDAAKETRSGRFSVFDPHMRAALQQRISQTNLARDALLAGRFRAFYQPKIDLQTGRVAGFEALARWIDQRGTIHQPGSIAAAFTDWDVATAITDRMLAQVIADMRAWQDRGVAFGRIGLNAAAADFQRANFAEFVLERLHAAGLPPSLLQIEVTETVLLTRQADTVEQTLRLLHGEGVTIALDDFGTGYASLSHLSHYPVDDLKIDRSFISGLDGRHQPAVIAEAIVALGRKLRLDVVAEGIEQPDQARRLRALGCPFGQGYLFSAAVPADGVPDLAQRQFDI